MIEDINKDIQADVIPLDYNNLHSIDDKNIVLKWYFSKWDTSHSLYHYNNISLKLNEIKIKARNLLKNKGFVVFDLNSLFAELDNPAFLITKFISLFGEPIRVFKSLPGHWRILDVDLNRPSNRSRGIGAIPLHLDFVNAEQPPDLICLMCIRSDPAGGGISIISDFTKIKNVLKPETIKILSKPIFSDGQVVNLSNVGEYINPFSILASSETWKFRYTSHMLKLDMDSVTRKAIYELERVLQERIVRFLLKKNQLLIINQHKVLHGREPLGGGQQDFPYEKRRFIYHSFIRSNEFHEEQ